MNQTVQLVNSLIRNRRSTFANGLKSGGKINDDIIKEILDNAIWAPSHGLVQAWHFKVFTGEGVKSFLICQQKIYKETTSTEKFNESKYNKYLEKVDKYSHIITVICKRDPKRKYPKQEDIVSVACAVQNIYLSLNAHGIAGYLSTGDICYTDQMRDYLGLENEDECIGFFMLGIADETLEVANRQRTPAVDKTEWIRE